MSTLKFFKCPVQQKILQTKFKEKTQMGLDNLQGIPFMYRHNIHKWIHNPNKSKM